MEFKIRPATKQEWKYSYAMDREIQKEEGFIGYLRGDFGAEGESFFTTWFEFDSKLKTDAFVAQFDDVINWMRQQSVLKNRKEMRNYCRQFGAACRKEGMCGAEYCFCIETPNYRHYARLRHVKGDYDFYVFNYSVSIIQKEE